MIQNNSKMVENYFKLLAVFIPITSVLVIPSVQGTLPSYILSVFLLILVFLFYKSHEQRNKILKDILIFIYIFLFLNLISQLSNGLIGIQNLDRLVLVDNTDVTTEFLRKSLFTQSIYIIPCLILFCFIKNSYKAEWDRYVFAGICIYVLFGFYEFFYYIIFQDFGDFVSNRKFGDHETIILGNQLMTISGFTFQRINGLAVEPSMFAFTVLPFWIYSLHVGRKKTSYLLLCGLILTASTTALLGIAIYCLYAIFKKKYFRNFILLMMILLLTIIFWEYIFTFLDKTILQKLLMKNESGMDRGNFFFIHLEYFMESNILTQLFGIGFGYIRSTDFFSTLLVNNGLVGLFVFTALFFYPVIVLQNTYKNVGIKLSIIVIYFTMMISVPEYSYLSIWLFLGIAYKEVYKENIDRKKNTGNLVVKKEELKCV